MTNDHVSDLESQRGSDWVVDWIADLTRHGEPRDDRDDVDTGSLKARFSYLANVVVTEHVVMSEHGPLPARMYLPPDVDPAGPALVWIHGGGFIIGHLDSPEANWTSLAVAARGIPVISLDYHKALHGIHHPVPLDDVTHGWMFANDLLREVGFLNKSIHLGGASAGAALSSALAVRLRDRGDALPASLLLVYPLAHSELPEISPEIRAAVADLPAEQVISPGAVVAMNANYLGSYADAARDAFAGESELRGLPPVFILNSERDTLRASGEKFASQLRESGVEVVVETQRAVTHGHLNDPEHADAVAAVDRLVSWMHVRNHL